MHKKGKYFMSLVFDFSIRRLSFFLLFLFVLFWANPVWSQNLFSGSKSSKAAPSSDEDDSLGVEVNFTFVSNYVFRGDDLFENAALLKGRGPGTHSGQFAFQPDITFSTPIEGLSFNMWFSVALADRESKNVSTEIEGVDANVPVDGLEGSDEIDYSILYETETGAGSFGFGLLAYTYIQEAGKTLGETELNFFYSPPSSLLPGVWGELFAGLYLNIYTTLYAPEQATSEYFQFGYAYSYDITDDIYLSLDFSANYQIVTDVTGIKHLELILGTGAYGLFFDFYYIRRIKDEFFIEEPGDSYEKDLWYVSFGYGIEL